MEWDYETLIADFKDGRELEFIWNGGKYSINCSFPDKWFFSIYSPQITFEATSVDELISRIYFGEKGVNFKDILPSIKDSTLF